MYIFVVYREKNEHNEKSKEVLMKGLFKSEDDKVRNCKSTMEVLDRLQCLHDENSHVAQEETGKPEIG